MSCVSYEGDTISCDKSLGIDTTLGDFIEIYSPYFEIENNSYNPTRADIKNRNCSN